MAYKTGIFQTKEKEHYLVVINNDNYNIRWEFSDKVKITFQSGKTNLCLITLSLKVNLEAPIIAFNSFPIQTIVKLPLHDYLKENIEFEITIMDTTGNNINGMIYIFPEQIVII